MACFTLSFAECQELFHNYFPAGSAAILRILKAKPDLRSEILEKDGKINLSSYVFFMEKGAPVSHWQ